MKNVKRIAALLLALVMVFALCACSSDDGKGKDKDKGEAKKTDAELIVGTWEGEIQLGDLIAEELAADPDMGEMASYFDFSDVTATLTFSFEKDGSYTLTMTADNDAFKAAVHKAYEELLTDMLDGTGMTLEDAAAAEGMTVEEFIDAVVEDSVGTDDVFDDEDDSGEYEIKNGKLYLFAEGDEKDEGTYYEIKLSEGKLTLVASYTDGEIDESEARFCPIELAKK